MGQGYAGKATPDYGTCSLDLMPRSASAPSASVMKGFDHRIFARVFDEDFVAQVSDDVGLA